MALRGVSGEVLGVFFALLFLWPLKGESQCQENMFDHGSWRRLTVAALGWHWPLSLNPIGLLLRVTGVKTQLLLQLKL